jgi:hypothetical protein
MRPQNADQETAQALWYVGAERAEIRAEPIAAAKPGEVTLAALYGGISRGTERLVFAGRVPPSEFSRMRGPFMAGDFPFPVKYGYATVGRVAAGPPELLGRTAFALHPHQTLFTIPSDRLALLPETVPPARGVLAANMETALNALWDASPGPGDRIAVVGGGAGRMRPRDPCERERSRACDRAADCRRRSKRGRTVLVWRRRSARASRAGVP